MKKLLILIIIIIHIVVWLIFFSEELGFDKFNYKIVISKYHSFVSMVSNDFIVDDEFIFGVRDISKEIDPTSYSVIDKQNVLFVYDSLVYFDEFFNVKPSLAVSWGILSDTVWQFNLRKNIKFNNGEVITVDDIISSFNRAKNHPNTSLKSLINTVQSVKKGENNSVIFTTNTPSPTFLADIANLYILPKEYENNFKLNEYIGSGAYKVQSINDQEIVFIKNNFYWNNVIRYPNKIFIRQYENKFARMSEFKKGNINVLVDVPENNINNIQLTDQFNLIKNIWVKSTFLMFNMKNYLLKNYLNRNYISSAINYEELSNVLNYSGKISSQFVGSGIFWYNPDINFTSKTNKDIITNNVFLNLYTAKEYRLIADFIKKQLETFDKNIHIHINEFDNTSLLINSFREGRGELYLLGWSFDIGSIDTFLNEFINSNGKYSGYYLNMNINQKIKTALHEMDEEKRLHLFQEIMKTIVEDDKIWVPLFSNQNIIAEQSNNISNIGLKADGTMYFK